MSAAHVRAVPPAPAAPGPVGLGAPLDLAGPLDRGRRELVLRRGRVSVVVARRSVVAVTVLVVLTLVVAVLTLATGDFPVAPADVLRALTGRAEGRTATVVLGWRLPRVVLGVVLGAALGVAGAMFQSLSRNPLGSPDIIGFSNGAYAGAVLVLLSGGTGYLTVAAGAVGGGLVTALVVYLLAWRRGVQGFRLIVVGIGVSAVISSVTTWLVLQAEVRLAVAATVWGAGTLNGVGWDQVRPAAGLGAVLLLGVVAVSRGMHALELGDDAGAALGVGVERTRLAVVVVGVALTAVATALTGPIAFVALAAPQLARRVLRAPGTTLVGSAAMGAFLLVACDLVAQRAFAPQQLPVGVVTVSLGGAYLVWLLVHEARSR